MSSWIFQGNPDLFRIDEYLRTRKHIVWAIRQRRFIQDISAGDEIYVWRSNGHDRGTGGIVARGTIASTPRNLPDDAPELWIGPQAPLWDSRVEVLLDEVRLTEEQGMITRTELLNDPRLDSMLILKFPSQTNYKLETTHTKHIDELWGQRRR